MRTRISSRIRCFALKWLILAGFSLLASSIAIAQAPASIFQLNGDPTNTSVNCTPPYTIAPTTCDSWNGINLTGTSGSGRLHSGVNSFILGTTNTFNFTTGGSKDANPVSSWAYSSTSTPNKDTLDAAYAAAYSISDFDVIFGADRLSPNGDANIGIWFFQENVVTNGTGGFTGAHEIGDVFVISAFTGGGGTSSIFVYEWDTACASGVKNPTPGQCADTNLRLLADPTSVCGASFYCATTNGKSVTASWATGANGYTGSSLASPLFFEGGVDITQAFSVVGKPVPCFSSFLVETRSSQSTTAVLKDFLLGGFNVCSMSITKACGISSVNSTGTEITYPVSGMVTNTGIGKLYGVQVQDCIGGSGFNALGVCTGTLDTINVGDIGPGASAAWNDSSQTTSSSQMDAAFALAATSSGGARTLQSVNTASVTCSNAPSTTLTLSKSCKTTLQVVSNTVQVLVTYDGAVCNTGPSQVTGIALTDYPDSSNTGGVGTQVASGITLGPGTVANPTCIDYGKPNGLTYSPTLIDQTVPGSDGIAGDGQGRYFFSDLLTISSATATVGSLTQITSPDPRTNKTYGMATASCPICQGTSECTTP